MLGRAVSLLLLSILALAEPAAAETSEADRAARWSDLRHAISRQHHFTQSWPVPAAPQM
jgi:hypothetical protein